MKRRAAVVFDLGFGDAGKGLLTDYWVRRAEADLVVRFNGGAQAGHNVVTADGRHHTFAQFGAGTFARARTALSRTVILHPTALVVEADGLCEKGITTPLSFVSIHEDALVVTPFHQAVNRLRELARGKARHGSCGVGIGEAVRCRLEDPALSLVARDLCDRAGVRRKGRRLQDYLRAEADGIPRVSGDHDERRILDAPGVLEAWIERAHRVSSAVKTAATWTAELSASRSVVFEGAQGILLDEDYGFHPHTTWSSCTPEAALDLARDHGFAVETIGVLRGHAVRHGAGPLPTETDAFRAFVSDHNRTNLWQGPVRYGWFDAVLARYALGVARGVDRLAVTHLDLADRFGTMRVCSRYEEFEDVPVPRPSTLAEQARVGETLATVQPVVEPVPVDPRTYRGRLAEALRRPVDLFSVGPTAADVRENP